MIAKRTIFSTLTVVGLTLSGVSHATLFDRGSGLIYDDVLNVTWLQDANYARTTGHDLDGRMNWTAANVWAANLSYDGGIYGTIDDWRLPDVKPVNNSFFQFVFSFDGTTDQGFNINSTQSEMGYMFYQNLGNTGQNDTSGNPTGCVIGPNSCLTNTGSFANLDAFPYWSAVENEANDVQAWVFNTITGDQTHNFKGDELQAWAVRSGDVSAVPVPAAFWLMASGLFGMAGLRNRRKLV